MPYQLSDAHTSGDAGMIATGENLEVLFADSAYGLTDIMADPEKLREEVAYNIELEEENLEDLYFSWLSELVYYKDAEMFLVKRCMIEIQQNENYKLRAVIHGDKIDAARHQLRVDVKAVTYYRFKIEKVENFWLGEVIFDI